MVPEALAKSFFDDQHQFAQKNAHINKSRTDKKYQQMLDTLSSADKLPSVNTKAILNTTSVEIPTEVELLFSLGPKFALPYTRIAEIPFFHVLADVESILAKTEENTQERTRCAIANNMQNFLHSSRRHTHQTTEMNFYKLAERKTKMFLKEHPNLLAINADKGNRTVVMDRADYATKMNQLLNDTHTYKKQKSDPTSSFQTKNNAIVQHLYNVGCIDATTKRRLTTYKAVCPRIYGQPKAHKPGVPLRPVVPCMTAPSYDFLQYIGSILKGSLSCSYNITSSFTFCEFINNIQLPYEYVLLSFDVVSLMCIPKQLIQKSVFKH